jgi:transcriptional regulator with XRE-family HTH domain
MNGATPINVSTPQKDLGARLHNYRENKGLSLEKLSGLLTALGVKISPSMISCLERGVTRGSMALRRRLLDFLGEGQD